ncbi:putative ATP-binding protein involved in virulence [Catalinimonas alkaloidigena]|uniref:AAA family ATPase n=1 Tax=Catalinimonas alkaloidigena TaxID=1075417 RepID=UPI0024051DC2|nr:AAA family ATPase [Catalinimonas alkaloidigena]MDF9800253.1 putative ATP-binding protein involved in virulence [Catalinimonas alkaloidigena]
MRIQSLDIKNIGPFREGHIEFITENDKQEKPPVTIVTGENGTGKTIILDAIRGLFLGYYSRIERDIVSNENDFVVDAQLIIDHKTKALKSDSLNKDRNNGFITDDLNFNFLLTHGVNDKSKYPGWVIDYWTSKLATDGFDLKSLTAPKPENYLLNALSGIHQNVEVTQLITYFDYLKSSDNDNEKKMGEALFEVLKKVIKLSLNNGEFKYVARKTLTPIIEQNGKEISLDKLSSGNLYLIQHMVSMLGKMYSANVLSGKPLKELCHTPGLLLIDEAENHLHPKWQKTFVNNILEVFPNLQIILTTHSPFIVASVENSRIYVCESREDHAEIVDETDVYSNKPIDEILLTPLFNTQPFNEKISELIDMRKKAIEEGDNKKRDEIEKKLKSINPQYFSYFDVEDLLSNLSGK